MCSRAVLPSYHFRFFLSYGIRAMRHQAHYYQSDWITNSSQTLDVDVCVYGGTAAGIVAGITAVRRGRSAVVLNPGTHAGGMTTGGLGWTDIGNKHVIGGASRQFYRDLGKLYGAEETWCFTPTAAMTVMRHMIEDARFDVRHKQFLDRAVVEGGKIREIVLLGGMRVRARMFIDATYEGDLMAAAGVPFTVGREANATYNETLNGAQVRQWHQFSHRVDPYIRAGDASSGLLPNVIADDMTQRLGQGDRKVQAYNFRVCMTNAPDLRIAWQKPASFDPRLYVLATRWFNSDMDASNDPLPAGRDPLTPRKFDVFPQRLPGGFGKTDTNNFGPVSSDFIGANWDWPEANYERREQLFQAHVSYQQGLYWHLANDPAIPQKHRDAHAHWGLPRDEFEDTGHWPHQLYVREARRMVSDLVITEHVCLGRESCDDAVGMGAYNMDSHNCCRFVHDGRVVNDGDVQVKLPGPYPISYRAIVPPRGACGNLFVPVCLSATHIAYGSARMEPVFMILGESAAIAADVCLRETAAVQNLQYSGLRDELLAASQVLSSEARNTESGNPVSH